MTYYRVVKDDVWDYRTGWTTIQNEILTPIERERKFPSLSSKCFEKVEISRARTYWSFGARFEYGKERG